MTTSVNVLTLVALLALTLFVGFLNILFWRFQREDRTPLWLGLWITCTALIAVFRLLQYSPQSEPTYLLLPRIQLSACYLMTWFGYELANSFTGYRPPRWERILFLSLAAVPFVFLWAGNLVAADQLVTRTLAVGGTFPGVAVGPLVVPVNLYALALNIFPMLRLFLAQGPHKRENLLVGAGILFVILFNLFDILTFEHPWIRMSDFSYLPLPVLFSYIQVRRYGGLYRKMNAAVRERTAELRRANEALQLEVNEREKAQTVLQESEARYRALLAQSAEAVYLYEVETKRVTEANPALLKLLGYTADEIRSMTVYDIVAHSREDVDGLFKRVRRGEVVDLGERHWRRRNGSVVEVEVTAGKISAGGKELAFSVARDITERKRVEREIRRQAGEMTALYETTNGLVMERDVSKLLHTIVERAAALLGASSGGLYLCEPEKQQLRCVVSYNTPRDYTGFVLKYGEGAEGQVVETGDALIVEDYRTWPWRARLDKESPPLVSILTVPMNWQGRVIGVLSILDNDHPGAFNREHLRLITLFANQAVVAIENSNLLESELRRRQEADAIAEVGRDISASLELDVVLDRIARHAGKLLNAESSAVYLAEPRERILRAVAATGPDSEMIKQVSLRVGRGILGSIAQQKTGEIVNHAGRDPRAITVAGTEDIPIEHIMGVPVLSDSRLTGLIAVWRTEEAHKFKLEDLDFLNRLAEQVAIAIKNARLFEEIQRRLRETEGIAQVSATLGSTLDLEELLENVLMSAIHAIPPAARGSILLADPQGNLRIRAVWGYSDPRVRDYAFPPDSGYAALAFRQQRPVNIPDINADEQIRYTGDIPEINIGGSAIAAPLTVKDRPIGVIAIDAPRHKQAFSDGDLHLLDAMATSVALAIENARLFGNTERRLAEIQAVHDVSTALRSANRLGEALPIILDQLMDLVHAGGAALELVDPDSGEIVTELAHGAWAPVTGLRNPPGSGVSGHVMASSQPYVSSDVVSNGKPVRPELFSGLISVACVPVISQRQAIGALWVGRQTPIQPEEVSLLAAIGEMVGNFLHRMRLHEQTEHLLADLRVANQELSRAYDTTLGGWAKALELRDKETEGHSRRVTTMTARLAHSMGISEPDLTNIRRGVLLHDIGKMGVTDKLLHKTSSLSPEEWVEMRKHPKYAYDLLHPIPYLRPALDIPYCHHERWDGSGYPRGLKGTQIPLGARIFAAVDVYDALLYDRPYRPAWSLGKVLDYLRDQSGKQFDPAVVEAFIHLLSEKRVVSRVQ